MTTPDTTGRCPAAHTDDPSGCDGPSAAVRVIDQFGAETRGCVHHGAVLLASLESARVYPGPQGRVGDSLRAYGLARSLPPFSFHRSTKDGQ